MSKEHAEKLVNDLDSNQALYDAIAEASRKTLEVAKQHGYHVTEDELRDAMSKKLGTEIPNTTDGEDGADPLTCVFLSEAPGR